MGMLLFLVYVALHDLYAHSMYDEPIDLWIFLPVIGAVVLFLFVGRKDGWHEVLGWKNIVFSMFVGGCAGIVLAGFLSVGFVTTNYWFADSVQYERQAKVEGKRHYGGNGRRDRLSKHYVNLLFLDNGERFRLDDAEVYRSVERGDTVRVVLNRGLWGVPVIREVVAYEK